MNIEAIPVNVEFSKSAEKDLLDDSFNIRSVLVEIQHGLEVFYKNGDKTIIDLGAIPLAPMERNKLFELLGKGEVHIGLSSLGESEIYETLFSGVWVVKHRDEQGEISAMFIEVCDIPDIVLSQQDEISSSVVEIQELIDRL